MVDGSQPASQLPAGGRPPEDSEPRVPGVGIVGRARDQARWLFLGEIATRALQFLTSLYLARLLLPAEFGSARVAVVVWEVVALFGNTGLVATLVQRRDNLREWCGAAFWLNSTAALVTAAIAALVSLGAGRFYGEPLLIPFIALYAFGFVIKSAGGVSTALLTREVAFGRLAVIESGPEMVRTLATVVLAASGYGAWSLVLPVPFAELLRLGLLARLHPWRPDLRLRLPLWRGIVGYGKYVLGANVVGYLCHNGDYLIGGRLLGLSGLGIYERAFRFSSLLLDGGVGVVARVSFPTLSAVNQDRERLAALFLKLVRAVAIAALPAAALIFFAAPDAIAVLYGEQRWGEAVPLVRILIPWVALQSIAWPASAALYALGLARDIFRIQLVALLPILALIAAGASQGAAWLAAGIALGLGSVAIALLVCSCQAVGVSGRRVLGQIVPAVTVAVLAVGVAALAAAVAPFLAGIAAQHSMLAAKHSRFALQVVRLGLVFGSGFFMAVAAVRVLFPKDFAAMTAILRRSGTVAVEGT